MTDRALPSRPPRRIPLYQVLDERGFEVYLVNARHYQNVPGRKTDVCDSAWLQYRHAVGLLQGSFRPTQEICAFRTILRHRASLGKRRVSTCSTCKRRWIRGTCQSTEC
jgi:transposase